MHWLCILTWISSLLQASQGSSIGSCSDSPGTTTSSKITKQFQKLLPDLLDGIKEISTKTGKATYKLKICPKDGGSVVRSDKDTTVLGRKQVVLRVIGLDKEGKGTPVPDAPLYVLFRGGDVPKSGEACPVPQNEKTAGLNGSSVEVFFFCDRSADKETLEVMRDDDPCSYAFVVRTKSVCNEKSKERKEKAASEPQKQDAKPIPTPAPAVQTSTFVPKSRGLSGFSIFFLLVFCAIVLYFVCGVAYKRIVVGAQGPEQIPNYNFWLSCFRRCEAAMQSSGSVRRQPSHHYTDADDLTFDQPPLHPGGQDYQPVRGSINRSPRDEADERLLQV